MNRRNKVVVAVARGVYSIGVRAAFLYTIRSNIDCSWSAQSIQPVPAPARLGISTRTQLRPALLAAYRARSGEPEEDARRADRVPNAMIVGGDADTDGYRNFLSVNPG